MRLWSHQRPPAPLSSRLQCLGERVARRPPDPAVTLPKPCWWSCPPLEENAIWGCVLFPPVCVPGTEHPCGAILFVRVCRCNHLALLLPIPLFRWRRDALLPCLFPSAPLPTAPPWAAQPQSPLSRALYHVQRCLKTPIASSSVTPLCVCDVHVYPCCPWVGCMWTMHTMLVAFLLRYG